MTKEQQKKRKALGIWSYDGGNKPGPLSPPPLAAKKSKVGIEDLKMNILPPITERRTDVERAVTEVPGDKHNHLNNNMPDTITSNDKSSNDKTSNDKTSSNKTGANEASISQFQLVTEVNKAAKVTFSPQQSKSTDSAPPETDDSGRASRPTTASPSRRVPFSHVTRNKVQRQGSARAPSARGRPKSSLHKENSVLKEPPKKKLDNNAK